MTKFFKNQQKHYPIFKYFFKNYPISFHLVTPHNVPKDSKYQKSVRKRVFAIKT